jgi:hypothetical protein
LEGNAYVTHREATGLNGAMTVTLTGRQSSWAAAQLNIETMARNRAKARVAAAVGPFCGGCEGAREAYRSAEYLLWMARHCDMPI